MWTADNRPRYNRDKLRYPSDLTDAEWAHIEPLIPPGKPGGGKRRVAIREVINGVMYILSTGCQWRALPHVDWDGTARKPRAKPAPRPDNRPRYNRDKLRYPSDLTDAEWAHIEPLIPPGKPGGGKRRKRTAT